MQRVVVTGLGALTPVGACAGACFDALVNARSGIRPVPPDIYAGSAPLVAGRVEFDPSNRWPAHQRTQLDRATQLALIAAAQAIADAELRLTERETVRAGVYWGTGLGGATSIEESYRQLLIGNGRVRPTTVVLGMNNAAAGQISIAHGLR
ncbi:MAG: beta-ketoacyl synthase N-terminal-like domain-containing protein, partial [Gemmatimonadales bacterium]